MLEDGMDQLVAKIEVSVIIPAHNERPLIERAIKMTQSTLKNANLAGKIIIAEDGSNDGTRK